MQLNSLERRPIGLSSNFGDRFLLESSLRYTAVMVLIDRAKSRGELAEAVDGRRLIEVFISPIHFRLLLTRESIDDSYIDDLALIALGGTSGPTTSERA